jgi:hypothetical protein
MFVIVLDVNTCDLLLCPCMFVIVLDYVNTCDNKYLRNPIQSQTYKDIEGDHMYLRNPIQSQTYKDIEVDHTYLRNPIQSIGLRKYM